MSILNFMKQLIKKSDLLACSPILRVRGSGAYQSIFGGIISLIVLLLFTLLFILKLYEVVNNVNITSNYSQSDQLQSSNTIDNIQIAIGISNIKLGTSPQYFDIYLQQNSIIQQPNGTKTITKQQIKLQPCKLQDWINVGDHFQGQFNAFDMSNMLCIKQNQIYQMSGYQGSPDFKWLTLFVRTCRNRPNSPFPCATTTQINTFINSTLNAADFFKVSLFIVDSKVNAGQIYPIKRVIQKKIFLSFTDTLGSLGRIDLARYEVITDVSLLPYSQQQTLQGSFVFSYASSTVGIRSDNYVRAFILKSTNQLTVTRTVGKIDQTLSYVGGLFGLLFVFIQFVFASYNQIKYELYAAQSAFTLDQKGRKVKQDDFSIFTYFCYSLYDWLNLFGLAPQKWKKMKQIDQVRQQINSQLDATYLFRKIRNLQANISVLMSENKRICTLIARQPTLQQTQTQRKLLQFYDTLSPSLCQSHFDQHSKINNRIQPTIQQNSVNMLIMSKQSSLINSNNFMNNKQNQLSSQNNCNNNTNIFVNQQEQQQYKLLMNIIRDAYQQLQYDNDQLSKKILEKVPSKVKQAISKSRLMTKKIVVDSNFVIKKQQNYISNFLNHKEVQYSE